MPREQLWVPHAATPGQRDVAADLLAIQPNEHVWERYIAFCALSSLPSDCVASVLILTRQLKDSGLRPGTILTYVIAVVARLSRPTRECLRPWIKDLEKAYALEEQQGGAAEATLDDLRTFFASDQDPAWRCLVWTLAATGARPIDLFHVRNKDVRLDSNSISVVWRRRKGQVSRSEIYEAKYLFSWSLAPTEDVIEFIESSNGLLFAELLKQEKYAAVYVNNRLERCLNGVTSTSFRKRMENVLCASNISIPDRERLMDHKDRIGEAHYRRNLATHQKNSRASAHAERKRVSKRR